MNETECVLELVCHTRWLVNYALHNLPCEATAPYSAMLAQLHAVEHTLGHSFLGFESIAMLPEDVLALLSDGVLYALVAEGVLGRCPPTMHPFLRRSTNLQTCAGDGRRVSMSDEDEERLQIASQTQLLVVRWLLAEDVLSCDEMRETLTTVQKEGDLMTLRPTACHDSSCNEDDFSLHLTMAKRLAQCIHFFLGAHIVLVRSLLMYYCSTLLSVESVLTHITTPRSPPANNVYTLEDALLLWLRRVVECHAGDVVGEEELRRVSDLYLATNDGRFLCLAVAHHLPQQLHEEHIFRGPPPLAVSKRRHNWASIFRVAEVLGLWPGLFPEEVVSSGFTVLQLHLLRFVEELFIVLTAHTEALTMAEPLRVDPLALGLTGSAAEGPAHKCSARNSAVTPPVLVAAAAAESSLVHHVESGTGGGSHKESWSAGHASGALRITRHPSAAATHSGSLSGRYGLILAPPVLLEHEEGLGSGAAPWAVSSPSSLRVSELEDAQRHSFGASLSIEGAGDGATSAALDESRDAPRSSGPHGLSGFSGALVPQRSVSPVRHGCSEGVLRRGSSPVSVLTYSIDFFRVMEVRQQGGEGAVLHASTGRLSVFGASRGAAIAQGSLDTDGIAALIQELSDAVDLPGTPVHAVSLEEKYHHARWLVHRQQAHVHSIIRKLHAGMFQGGIPSITECSPTSWRSTDGVGETNLLESVEGAAMGQHIAANDVTRAGPVTECSGLESLHPADVVCDLFDDVEYVESHASGPGSKTGGEIVSTVVKANEQRGGADTPDSTARSWSRKGSKSSCETASAPPIDRTEVPSMGTVGSRHPPKSSPISSSLCRPTQARRDDTPSSAETRLSSIPRSRVVGRPARGEAAGVGGDVATLSGACETPPRPTSRPCSLPGSPASRTRREVSQPQAPLPDPGATMTESSKVRGTYLVNYARVLSSLETTLLAGEANARRLAAVKKIAGSVERDGLRKSRKTMPESLKYPPRLLVHVALPVDGDVQFRGLYICNPETLTLHRLYGVGPLSWGAEACQGRGTSPAVYYRFDVSRRSFTKLESVAGQQPHEADAVVIPAEVARAARVVDDETKSRHSRLHIFGCR